VKSRPPNNVKVPIAGFPGGERIKDFAARYVLLRYFDFDVRPGRVYRYRAKTISLNPAFGDKNVPREAAEGEERKSPWSEPSPAVTVENAAK
jgi:hypothetical protein